MNRWWGGKDDSDRQADERNQRSARRTISQLPVPVLSSDDDAEFADCDTSGLFGGVDGADDLDDSSSSVSDMNAAQA